MVAATHDVSPDHPPVKSALVGALFDAWAEFDLVLSALTAVEMIEPWFGGSAFGWTYAHVTNNVDAWLNVRFQQFAPHPLIGGQNFRFGGDGCIADWPE
ncbi:MAG TPA: hypothetical protein VIL85_15610, partial [Thermomicrobiales bacterium]